MALQRAAMRAFLGDPRFWEVVDAIAAENDLVGRPYKTSAQWQRLFAAAKKAVESGAGLPQSIAFGICRQRELLAEAHALGKSDEDRYRDELAAERAARLEAQAAPPRAPAASSFGRARHVDLFAVENAE